MFLFYNLVAEDKINTLVLIIPAVKIDQINKYLLILDKE